MILNANLYLYLNDFYECGAAFHKIINLTLDF